MVSDRSNVLCVYGILKEYSDEAHILTMSQLREKLQAVYGVKLDRRTIYSAIDALVQFGVEISRYEDNSIGYYMIERSFSPAEIRLLIDAVYSCEYISSRQTDELLEKLRGQLSVHDRKKYSYSNIVTPEKKSPNPEVFLNIEILDEAISMGKKVSFTYMDYDYDKTLKARRSEKYVVNPYSMICESEHYYLVLISQGHTDPSFYRIDMMKDIEILEEDVDISKSDAHLESASKVVYAHTGEPEKIHLRCDKIALRHVIERFGKDVHIIKNDDGSFDAIFSASPSGLVYWALQYLQNVEVLEPESVRQSVIQALANNKYQNK